MHAPDTGELNAIRVALTAPVVFVGPNAAAHNPTSRAFAVTVAVVMTIVLDVIVTTRRMVVGVAEGDEEDPPLRWIDATVSVVPAFAVTLPAITSANPPRCPPAPFAVPDGAPLRRPPPNPLGAPLGRLPVKVPLPVPKAPAIVQLPFVAVLTSIVVAVSGATDDDGVEGDGAVEEDVAGDGAGDEMVDDDRATMQEPILIEPIGSFFCWVIAVFDV